MRLFLLPISTRRTLLYCERAAPKVAAGVSNSNNTPPLSERIIDRASQTWLGWEKAEKGWQKQITTYGNKLFRRIPFEEWGLKSIPPATKSRLEAVDSGALSFQCLYPGAFLRGDTVSSLLQKLATERQALHRRRMYNCILWMPITIPFTLVPVIPNLPFFWLCFRAYSHYRALYGGRLLEHLLKRDRITITASQQLDELYTLGRQQKSHQEARAANPPPREDVEKLAAQTEEHAQDGKKEVLLLQTWNGKLLAEAFELPEMEIEIERAVEQVQKAIADEEGTTQQEKKSQ